MKAMNIDPQEIRQLIIRELPRILEEDAEIRQLVLKLSREHFADKAQTEDRFDRIMEELRREREEQSRRWDEQAKLWDEQSRRWDEQAKLWDEQSRRWDEQAKLWDEQNRRWDEQAKLWDEQNRRWDGQAKLWDEQNQKWWENQAALKQMMQAIRELDRRHDSTIGALGARWGLSSEHAFRSGLKGILQDIFDVEVINLTEYDDEGEVFGRPDQIELDLIIRDGTLIICEIKSSMSKADMYTFDRKVKFYERKHNRRASKALVISPMVDPAAQSVADQLGIQVYSYPSDIPPATLETQRI